MGDLYKRAENDTHRLSVYYDEGCNPREDDNLGTMVCWHDRYDLGDKHNYNSEEPLFVDLIDDEHDENDLWHMLKSDVMSLVRKNHVILPLYLYDHSGVTMNTTGFSCPWDSGQVGWIYASKERLLKETGYTEDELFSQDSHRTPLVGERVKIEGREDYAIVRYIDKDRAVIDFNYNLVSSSHTPENVVTVLSKDIIEVMSNKAVEMLTAEVETYDQYLRGDVYGFSLEKKVKCEHCGHTEYEDVDSCWGFFGDNFKENGMSEYIPEEGQELLDKLEYAR